MRLDKTDMTIKLWLSARDTYKWACISRNSWPCSELAGKRLFAEFNNGNLVDCTVNGLSVDIPRDEFTAITDDFIAGVEI